MIYSTDRENSQFCPDLGRQWELGAYWMHGGQLPEGVKAITWCHLAETDGQGVLWACVRRSGLCLSPALNADGQVWCSGPPLGGQGDHLAGWADAEAGQGTLPPSNAHGLSLVIALAVSRWLSRIRLSVAIHLVLLWIIYWAPKKMVLKGETISLLLFLLCISQSIPRFRGIFAGVGHWILF